MLSLNTAKVLFKKQNKRDLSCWSCECPLGTTLQDGRPIVASLKKSGLCTGFSHLQLKVKVVRVKVVNPHISILSSTAVTGTRAQKRKKNKHKSTNTGNGASGRVLVPLAVRVERHAVDGSEMSLHSAKLLLVRGVEEPENRERL